MLPPPITTAVCTPCACGIMISSAARLTASMSTPCPPLLQSASPDSLSMTRLKGPRPLRRAGAFAGALTAALGADLEALKADDLDRGAEGLRGLLHELSDGHLGVLHERLLEERPLGDELIDLASDDLLDDRGR